MWKRRQLFNAIFFIGTVIAAIGWVGELRGWHLRSSNFSFGNFAIAGHALQIIGLFGNLMTPDAVKDRNEFE
jgi:hypothetical protein